MAGLGGADALEDFQGLAQEGRGLGGVAGGQGAAAQAGQGVRLVPGAGFSRDRRAFDGSTASQFLRYISDAIQDRSWDAELS